MVAFNFSPEFADAVASGAKRQTIRKTARAKKGDMLQLYTGQRTKKGAIEEALRRLVRAYEQRQAIEDLRGLGWECDLDEMRADR